MKKVKKLILTFIILAFICSSCDDNSTEVKDINLTFTEETLNASVGQTVYMQYESSNQIDYDKLSTLKLLIGDVEIENVHICAAWNVCTLDGKNYIVFQIPESFTAPVEKTISIIIGEKTISGPKIHIKEAPEAASDPA